MFLSNKDCAIPALLACRKSYGTRFAAEAVMMIREVTLTSCAIKSCGFEVLQRVFGRISALASCKTLASIQPFCSTRRGTHRSFHSASAA